MNYLSYQPKYHFEDYYLQEYALWNGETFITFNIVYLDIERNRITVAISDMGKIILTDYELYQDCNGDYYFEYGYTYTKIYINEFEEITNEQ